MPTRDYRTDLLKRLGSPRYAAKYLKSALDEGDTEGFLLALRNVVEACGGPSRIAVQSDISRQQLHRILSGQGNPTLSTLKSILDSVGLTISITSDGKRSKAA